MTATTQYTIHYLLNGVGKHFHAQASHLDDGDAIRLATRHAAEGLGNWITLDTALEIAGYKAEKVGVTKVRWNVAV